LDPELVAAFQKSEAYFVELARPMIGGDQELPLRDFSQRWGLNQDHQYTLTPEWEHLKARKLSLIGKRPEECLILNVFFSMWFNVFTSAFTGSQGDIPFISADNEYPPTQMAFYLIPPEFLLRLPYLIYGDKALHYAPNSEIVSIDESARLAMRLERPIYTGTNTLEIHGGPCIPYLATFHDIIHTISALKLSFDCRVFNLRFQALLSSLTGLSPKQKKCVVGLRTLLIDQSTNPLSTYQRHFRSLRPYMWGLEDPKVLCDIHQRLPLFFSSDPALPEIVEGFRSEFGSTMNNRAEG